MANPITFIHALTWDSLSDAVKTQAELNLLDVLGVAAGGFPTPTSQIIRDHAHEDFGGTIPLLFDGRMASPLGGALAAGMMIDSLDGHDGFNPAKGHIAAPMVPAALMAAHVANASGRAFLEAVVVGYEIGARTAMAQHATCPDYHTSGSWGAVAAAAAVSRLMGLDADTTRHALGIAEYHAPRSQMMRCIDFPTMVKDGAGWGAMTGLSAARLAAKGFTGAPAITVEDAPDFWADLGERWYILEQYYKPYPVCRWAQAPMEGAMALQQTHDVRTSDIESIEIHTFLESVRLATKRPRNGEEAQYSTSFPVAAALVHQDVRPEHLEGAALQDAEVLRLSDATEVIESDFANEKFPAQRFARTTLRLKNGTRLEGAWMEPKWDHTKPPTAQELRDKFHGLADPVIGAERAIHIENSLRELANGPLSNLTDHLFTPIKS
ncbi:MmgE/PrpD family protein [Shimia thalassica]|uniref:MmgE/PrpD family protein n=1 Tax=Shimia thalassica TaxID=1715693 RepID=UPI002733B6E4|nr:MmgE/PrpD family protein [Shimia thalassica]MDP2495018.1 MmgE/PrpD family protein [Shimia thalassica]